MLVKTVSVPKGTGRQNEDFVGFVPTVAVVVDGAGLPRNRVDLPTRRRVVRAPTGRSPARPVGGRRRPSPPQTALADAIEQVTDEHRGACDTASPISPSAMVAVLRVSGGRAEYLVLGDATLVLERVDTEPLVVTDAREVVVSRAYIPALEAASSAGERDEVVRSSARAATPRAGSGWPRTTRGSPTRPSPGACRPRR